MRTCPVCGANVYGRPDRMTCSPCCRQRRSRRLRAGITVQPKSAHLRERAAALATSYPPSVTRTEP